MSFNPFWKLHYHISGGRRTNLIYVGLFVVLMMAIWYVTYRFKLVDASDKGPLSDSDRKSLLGAASATALIWVSIAQSVFVLLMAPFAIRKAVMRDNENGMLESHQLSPMSGLRVAIGYLTGPAIISWFLFAAGLLLGAFFSAMRARGVGALAGGAVGQWFGTQLVFLSLAILYCTATLLLSLHSPKKSALSPFLLVFILPFLTQLSPGIAILIGASGLVLFSSATTGLAPSAQLVSETVALSVLAQSVFAALFLFAASQKVRANRSTVFGVALGTLFVGLFGVVSLAGMRLNLINPSMRGDVDDMVKLYAASTAILMMFLAYYPLRATAVSMVQMERRGSFGGGGSLLRFIAVAGILTIFIDATLMAGFQLVSDSKINFTEIAKLEGNGSVPIAIFSAFIFDLAVLYRAARRGKTGILLTLFLIVLLRCVPFAIDGMFAIQNQADVYSDPTFDFNFSRASPFGTLVMAVNEGGNPWLGVAFQVLIAIGAVSWVMAMKPKPKSVTRLQPA